MAVLPDPNATPAEFGAQVAAYCTGALDSAQVNANVINIFEDLRKVAERFVECQNHIPPAPPEPEPEA